MSTTEQQASPKLTFDPVSSIIAKHVEEAPLYFANKTTDIDPKRGLALHGPADARDAGPETIRIGIVSSPQGIEDVTAWALFCNEHEIPSSGTQPFLAQTFPGFLKGFSCKLVLAPEYNESLLEKETSKILAIKNPNLRIKKAALLYSSKVHVIARRSSKPDVIICHEPEDIEMRCGAGMSIWEKRAGALPTEMRREAERIRKTTEGVELFAPLEEETLDLLDSNISQDFRGILKATCLDRDIPLQILTQSVLEAMLPKSTSNINEQRRRGRRQDPSIITWNIATAIYCKAGHSPWKVGYLRSGTCYIGISFYYDKTTKNKDMQAALAQIFTDTGEGLIVRGDSFNWDIEAKGTPRLTRESAFKLLSDAIEIYKQHHNDQPPNRVAIHKKSRFGQNELQGFEEALADVPKHDFVALSPDPRDFFFYRNGDNPILRGTSVKLDDGSHLLYSIGFIPYLNQYPHPRIPRPIEISEHHGDTPYDELAQETLALTRLNWNSTDYCSFWPVTLLFSHRVGDVLGRVQSHERIQQDYYYYM